MFDTSGQELIHLLATYGYLAVLVLVAVESIGIPVPGETMLLVASVYAGTTHQLHIGLVLAAAAGGAILGDNVGYVLGQTGGSRLLQRYGRRLHLDESKLRLGQYLFDRHGGMVVFAGRFVPVLRIWAAFLAGMHHMPWRRFLAFNAAGGALWATVMGTGAYFLGDTMLRLGGPIGIGSAALATLAMIASTMALRRGEQRLQREADGWLPAPCAGAA